MKSRGEIINFGESGGKCTKTGKIGGNPKFVVDDLKKRSSEILADENMGHFFGKRSNF